jgi:plasmid stabilization system protein ParE
MTRPLKVHPFAEDDLVETWQCYEAQAPGLGDRFLAAVHTAIAQVADWPSSGSPSIELDGHVTERRVATSGFPYLIRYRALDDMILVTAIYHQRRHPDFGSDRAL